MILQLRGRKQDSNYSYIQSSINPLQLSYHIIRNVVLGRSVAFNTVTLKTMIRQIGQEPARFLEWLFLWLNLDFLHHQIKKMGDSQFVFHFLFRSTLVGDLLNKSLKFSGLVRLHTSSTVINTVSLSEIFNADNYRFQAISEHCKSHFINTFDVYSEIEIVRQSVDYNLISTIKKSPSNDKYKMICAGRLIPKKGILELIACLAHLPNFLKKDLRVQIIGEGALENEINQAIKEEGLGDFVQLRGKLPHYSLLLEIANSDLMVVPSIETPSDVDGIPTVIIESMLLKTNVLTTSIGGIPELVQHRKTGFIFDPTKPETFHQVLSEVILETKKGVITAKAFEKAMKEYTRSN